MRSRLATSTSGEVAPRPGTRQNVIFIGASTGGTDALKELLSQLPAHCPGIVIVQHMPEMFTRAFVDRLNSICRIKVVKAAGGEAVQPGHAYVAPGDAHLVLARDDAGYAIVLSRAATVNRHRPSVDVLFRSAAEAAGRNALGILLTGMGRDGADGMRALKLAGAETLAQDEASCVVFGMPREAIALGGVGEVLPLKGIAARIVGSIGARELKKTARRADMFRG